MNKNWRGAACRMYEFHGRGKRVLVEKTEEKRSLEDLGVDGRIILR